MLLIRSEEAKIAKESEEAKQAHMVKWGAWIQTLVMNGNFVSGLPFAADGKVVSKSGESVTDGAYKTDDVSVGGYLHIKADSLDAAVELSKGCPVFEYDGTVEIRELMPMPMA